MYIISVAAFFTAYYFTTVVMPVVKQKLKILPATRLKPFDCTLCLSVWLAVSLYFLPIELSWFLAVIFGAGFAAIKIN
jgi:hypothetical protein